MKLYPGEYTIMDLLQVAASKNFRTAVTPFGEDARYHRYAGRAVAWKFAFDVAPKEVKEGLEKAIKLSKDHREEGVALVRVDGRTILVPKKVAEMMRAAGKRRVTILASGATAAEIISAMRVPVAVG